MKNGKVGSKRSSGVPQAKNPEAPTALALSVESTDTPIEMVLRDASLAQDRRGFMGRLAGVFFFGSGLLSLASLPVAASDLDVVGTAVVSVLAVVAGAIIWRLPWDSWPPRASLAVAPLGFALIASGNYYGGSQVHTYGVFCVVAFVWIGLAHHPGPRC